MASQTASTSRPLALIFDNDADTREMYALHLRWRGMSVVEANDGEHALEVAKTFLPDVITTDLQLDGFSVATLCQRLKDSDATKAIPLIVVTGRAMPHEVTAALAAGCVSLQVNRACRRRWCQRSGVC